MMIMILDTILWILPIWMKPCPDNPSDESLILMLLDVHMCEPNRRILNGWSLIDISHHHTFFKIQIKYYH